MSVSALKVAADGLDADADADVDAAVAVVAAAAGTVPGVVVPWVSRGLPGGLSDDPGESGDPRTLGDLVDFGMFAPSPAAAAAASRRSGEESRGVGKRGGYGRILDSLARVIFFLVFFFC